MKGIRQIELQCTQKCKTGCSTSIQNAYNSFVCRVTLSFVGLLYLGGLWKIITILQFWRLIILFKHMCVLPYDTAQYLIDLPRYNELHIDHWTKYLICQIILCISNWWSQTVIMSLLYHTRFKIPLVLACLYILFLKNIVFLDKGLAMPIKHVLCYTT